MNSKLGGRVSETDNGYPAVMISHSEAFMLNAKLRNKQSAIMAGTNTTTQEYEILTSFLLSRASLQNIITLPGFTKLFPKDHRNNPQVKLLYRELQLQQNKTCERVKKNIQLEVRLGAKQRRDAKKEEREGKGVEDDVMMGIEVNSGFSKQLFVMALIFLRTVVWRNTNGAKATAEAASTDNDSRS